GGGVVVVPVQPLALVALVADEVAGAEDEGFLLDADLEALGHGWQPAGRGCPHTTVSAKTRPAPHAEVGRPSVNLASSGNSVQGRAGGDRGQAWPEARGRILSKEDLDEVLRRIGDAGTDGGASDEDDLLPPPSVVGFRRTARRSQPARGSRSRRECRRTAREA